MIEELLLVGIVARAHGNKGQVIVNPETDFPGDRFAPGNVLIVEHAGQTIERRIATARFQQGRPIIGFEGVETMNDAESLAGAVLKVPVSDLAPLPGGTYYRHDLVGCEVKDTAGQPLGRVIDVEGSMGQNRLVLDGSSGEVLIPMVEGICLSVETAARVIVVDPPDGLIALNEQRRRTSDSE